MKTCDLCNAEVTEVIPLDDEYQTEEIKELCRPCRDAANEVVFAVLAKGRAFLRTTKQNAVLAWFKKVARSA